MDIPQILGFIGATIVIAAYLPQVMHLVKERCSAGISLGTYALWFLASLLLLAHALMIEDMVFITLQVFNLFFIAIIYFFARKYKTMACQSHLKN